jgi:hypothetical protein
MKIVVSLLCLALTAMATATVSFDDGEFGRSAARKVSKKRKSHSKIASGKGPKASFSGRKGSFRSYMMGKKSKDVLE